MNSSDIKPIINPPKLMSAIVAGFNVISNHIILILFPVVLDIVVWLGPKLSLQKVLEPIIQNANQTLKAYNNVEMAQLLESAQEAWSLLISRINLTTSISTFPLGIPSLLNGVEISSNPLGKSISIEIPSLGVAFLVFVLLVAVGLIIGGLYFSAIAKSIQEKPERVSISGLGTQLIRIFVLLFIIIGILLIVIIPALFIISIFALFSPMLAQIVLLILSFVLIWLLIPLIFSPHGIFLNQLNVVRSVITSFRMVRLFLPGTGLFLLISILIAQGLDILWLAAPTNSWLTLIGIIGHAFIYTSLITASFIYYRQGLDWMEKNIQQITHGLTKII